MLLLPDTPLAMLLLVVVALSPAAIVWWTGRALARTLDDPLFPERLHAMKGRARSLMALAWVLIAVLAPSSFWSLIPLMLFARAIAAYPLRRQLYGESWNIFQYVWFFTRLTTAFFGFFVLLVWTPSLLALTGRADWLAALALAVVLVLWNEWSGAIIRGLTRSAPVTDPELVERFGGLVAQTGLQMPRFEIVPMGGGVLANAVALPSRRGSSVLMSSTFADRFDRDEIIAIAGHELAHLEYYSGRRLLRIYAGNLVLIAGAVLAEPLARVFVPTAIAWVSLTWFVFVICYQAIWTRSRQKNETASDLRAVELTGDPEPLARALIKLHAMGRVPRRWNADFERHASHPSLARRIKAIRDAAGREAVTLEQPETFVSGGLTVALEHDRLRWSENGLEHAVAYSRLVELRVDGSRPAAPRLVAVDRSRKRWSFTLSSDDAQRAQRALDFVDGRLAETPAASISAVVVRVVAVMTAVVAFGAMQFAGMIPILLAFARPCAALAAGAAASAIVSALLFWRDGGAIAAGWAWSGLMLAICGTALMTLAWLGRRDESPQLWKPLTLLAVCAALACAGVFASGGSAVQLHLSAHASPSAIVLPAALAAALAWTRRAAIRRAAVPVVVVAVLVFGLGSRTYVESFGRDRFFAKGPALTVADLEAAPLSETTLPFTTSAIVVSPGGTRIAVQEDDDDRDEASVFHVGSPSGPFEPVECDEVFFLSEDRLLTVNRDRSGVVLREVRIANREVLRERRVDGVTFAIVRVDQQTARWSVLGTGTNQQIVRIEGGFAGEPDTETRWPRTLAPSPAVGWVQPVAATRTNVLVRNQRYHAGPFGYGSLAAALVAFTPSWMESDFWIAGSDDSRRMLGTSGLTIDCSMHGVDDRPLCTAFDGSETTIFSLDLERGHLDATTTLHGHFSAGTGDATGWIAGRWDGRPIAFRTGTPRAWRIRVGDDEWVRSAAANDHVIAVVGTSATRSIVRTYRTP